MRRSSLLRLLPLVLVAACIPSRDNPDDPSIGPQAKLRVLDEGWPDAQTGDCAPPAPGAALPEVSVASHGRCLILDASLSTDRRGNALGSDASFEYLLLSTGATPLASPLTLVTASSAARVLLPASARQTLPFDTGLRLQVVVTAGGDRGRGESSLVLQNSVPVAVSDPLRILPPGGFPWSPGASYTLPFYGDASFDADQDRLGLCWHFFDGQADPPCRHRGEPPVMHVVPSDPGEFVAQVVASDGTGRLSTPVRTIVRMRPEPTWGAAPLGFAPIEQLGSEFIGSTTTPATPESVAFVNRGSTSRIVYGTSTLQLFGWPDSTGAALSSATEGTASPQWLVGDPDDDLVWGVSQSSGADGVEAWNLTGDTLTGAFTAPGPTSFLQAGIGQEPAIASRARVLWIAVSGAELVETVDAQGGNTPLVSAAPLPPKTRIAGFGIRPGVSPDEEWIALANSDGGPDVELARWVGDAAPSSTPQPILAADPSLQGGAFVGWVDPYTFWAASEGELLLVDATMVETGRSIDEATILSIPLPPQWSFSNANGLIDPGTGAYVACSAGVVIYAWPDGTSDEGPAIDGCEPLAVDAQGRLWFNAQVGSPTFVIRVSRAGFTGSLGIDRELSFPHMPIPGPGIAVADHGTGGLWIATTRPSLVQLTADGRTREYDTYYDTGAGQVEPLTRLAQLAASPDGQTLWAVDADPASATHLELMHFTLAGGVLSGGAVPGSAGAVSTTVAARGPYGDRLWAGSVPFGNVAEVTTAGQISNVLAVPESAQLVLGAGADGGLCAADGPFTPDGTNYFIRVRHMNASHGVDWTHDLPLASFSDVPFGVVDPAANPKSCWVGWLDEFSGATGELDAIGATGAIRHSYAISGGEPSSIVAPSIDEVWYSLVPDETHVEAHWLRFPPSVTNTPSDSRKVDGQSGALLR